MTKIPDTLRKEILDYLNEIPNLWNTIGRRAYIETACLDSKLINKIIFDGATDQFWSMLLLVLEPYTSFSSGDPLISILKASKEYVGREQKDKCEQLINGYYNCKERNPNDNGSEIDKDVVIDLQSEVRISPYKLFYYRYKNYKIAELSKISGISREELYRLEKVSEKPGLAKSFPLCKLETLYKLEKVLESGITFKEGQPDDFHSKYVIFYANYKKNRIHPPPLHYSDKTLFTTKVIVFDFDGTLTRDSNDNTTWERIWLDLGYRIEECESLYKSFCASDMSDINHKKWCNITKDKFRDKGLSEEQVISIAKSIELWPGTSETLKKLHDIGIKLYLLSGSIKLVIQEVLGPDWKLFEEVTANNLIFDRLGNLNEIIGTRYDFKAKRDYIINLIYGNCESPLEILYIGNSNNDKWVCESGVRTLCVNPIKTDPYNVDQWTYYEPNLETLNQILKYIP